MVSRYRVHVVALSVGVMSFVYRLFVRGSRAQESSSYFLLSATSPVLEA